VNGISSVSAARDAAAVKRAARGMALEESRVLSQEAALKSSAPGSKSSTVYKYEIGPDGRRYIAGAEVTITGDEKDMNSVPGLKTAKTDRAPAEGETDDGNKEAIAELERTERDVIAHENAHKAAAGRFGGPAHYTYTTGPDGKRYITGGDVQVHTPATNDPEEALRNARQVMRAALAPGNPSGQDIAVAASASAMASAARSRIARRLSEPEARTAVESYKNTSSPKGLWTSTYGYEPARAEAA
jgi:hypothetical protein